MSDSKRYNILLSHFSLGVQAENPDVVFAGGRYDWGKYISQNYTGTISSFASNWLTVFAHSKSITDI